MYLTFRILYLVHWDGGFGVLDDDVNYNTEEENMIEKLPDKSLIYIPLVFTQLRAKHRKDPTWPVNRCSRG